MNKWEYIFVTHEAVSEEKPHRLIYISEPALEDEVKDLNQAELANFLGDQGWELISRNPILTTTVIGRYLENWPQSVPQEFKLLPAIATDHEEMVFKRLKE